MLLCCVEMCWEDYSLKYKSSLHFETLANVQAAFCRPVYGAIRANTGRAASMACSINSDVWAAETKPASYADGPNATPLSNMPWKKVLKPSVLEAAMSA